MSTSSSLVAVFNAPSTLLRKALSADALLSGLTGFALAFGSDLLGNFLGLKAALLLWSGIILIPFAAFVAYLAARDRVLRLWVIAVIVGNVLWAAASILLLLIGWIKPNLLGEAFVFSQAVIVAILAELEYLGLRRSA